MNDLFVIAGDAREPAGDFPDAAALLSAMGGLRERFAEIGISGYPESHHLISDETTIQAMFEKESMATYIVSQICFDAEVIVTWVRRVHARGTLLPIWIGVAGTISNRRLLRIAGRVGLGDSARLLKAHGAWVRRLVRPGVYTPTRLIRSSRHRSPTPQLGSPASTSTPSTSWRGPRNGDGSSSTGSSMRTITPSPIGPREGDSPLAEINEHPGVLLYTRIRKSPYFYASRRHGVRVQHL